MQDDYYLQVVSSCVTRIIIDAYRLFQKKETPVSFPAFNEHGLGSAVYTVVRYIDQHYKEITDIRAVAKELGYSCLLYTSPYDQRRRDRHLPR